MEWLPIEKAPLDTPMLAWGFPLEPFSKLRGEREIVFAYRSQITGAWFLCGSRTLLEPFGWMPIPEIGAEEIPAQNLAEGSPKFEVGETANFSSRYEGIVQVKVKSIINWPSGWWYELDRIDNPGHGNPRIGTDSLWIDDTGVFGRPARESELSMLDVNL
jgi:hypothetical protein